MQERFKQLLEEKNLTATRFAALIKVNASAMSHILNGRSKPGFDVLDKIAQAFPDVNLNWLISGKGSLYNTIPAESEKYTPKAPVENIQEKNEEPLTETTSTAKPFMESAPVSPVMVTTKKMKRIILFFEDGSFEDYEK